MLRKITLLKTGFAKMHMTGFPAKTENLGFFMHFVLFNFISTRFALTSLEEMQICTVLTEFYCLRLSLMFML